MTTKTPVDAPIDRMKPRHTFWFGFTFGAITSLAAAILIYLFWFTFL